MTETKLKTPIGENMSIKSSEVPTNQQQKIVEKLSQVKSKNGGWNITCPDCQRLVNVKGYKEGKWKKCRDCLIKSKLITLTGITTSQVQTALKANNPYPARVFLKLDCVDCHNTKQLCQALTPKHKKCEECPEQKCRKCEIPIFFRIKENGNWTKPKIPKYSYLEVQGHYSNSDKSERPSFTAYSYQLLDPNLQGKFTLAQATQQLPHFEQAYQQIKQIREYLESYDRRLYTFKK